MFPRGNELFSDTMGLVVFSDVSTTIGWILRFSANIHVLILFISIKLMTFPSSLTATCVECNIFLFIYVNIYCQHLSQVQLHKAVSTAVL